MSTTPKNYKEMLARVQQSRGIKTASDATADTEALNMKDPADKGTKTIPAHPEGDSADKTGIPAKNTNEEDRKSVV